MSFYQIGKPARKKGKPLPSFVAMQKDYNGIYFQADGCGSRRFKTVKEATEAYRVWCQRWEEQKLEERLADDRLALYDGETFTVHMGRGEANVYPCSNRDDARRIYNRHYLETHTLYLAAE